MIYDKYNKKELKEYIVSLSSDKLKKDNQITCLKDQVEELEKMLNIKDEIIITLRDNLEKLKKENKELKIKVANYQISKKYTADKNRIRGGPYV